MHVEGEGLSTELGDTDRAEADEADVEEEGIHQGSSRLHGVNCKEYGDAESELEVALNHTILEPKRVDSKEYDSEEGPDSVHGSKPVVQKAVYAKDGVEEDMQDPRGGKERAKNAEDKIGPVPQNTNAVGLVGLHSLVPFFFQHVNLVTPVVVDRTTRGFAAVLHSIFDERIAHLTDEYFTIFEFHIVDGLGAKTPGIEEVDWSGHEADATENAEQKATEQCEHSDEVQDKRQLEQLYTGCSGDDVTLSTSTFLHRTVSRNQVRGLQVDGHLSYREEEVGNNTNDCKDDQEHNEATEGGTTSLAARATSKKHTQKRSTKYKNSSQFPLPSQESPHCGKAKTRESDSKKSNHWPKDQNNEKEARKAPFHTSSSLGRSLCSRSKPRGSRAPPKQQ